MKKLFFTLLFAVVLSCISASAQKIELEKVIIDKDSCTITRKSDGKVFNLYGRFKIDNDFYDFRVKIVDHNEDVRIKVRDNSTDWCCEFTESDFYDVKVKIDSDFYDLRVKIDNDFPGISRP